MAIDAELQRYHEEACSWDADRLAQTARSLRAARIVAAGAVVCAISTSAALFMLMPLKRVDPFVIRVDNTTGVVDVVPVYAGASEMPQAITRYFLNHYVTVCERFTFATAESDYSECGAFHGVQRNQEWSAAWDRSNRESPLNVHKDGSSLQTQVTAISFFTRANGAADLAQVRYVKSRRKAGASVDQRTAWIATVQYAYGEPSKNAEVRRWNPLGFKVLEFRREAESIVEAPTSHERDASTARGAPSS